jgi:Predicted xylanase/chitin deacetylase
MLKQHLICYPEGKFKALTLSYDDGKIGDRRLVRLFNKYGIKATFHLNGQLMTDTNNVFDNENEWWQERLSANEAKELYKGHEIAAHTATHPTIARCPIEKVTIEVLEDRKILEKIVKYPVRGMSYPNGSYSNEIKAMLPFVGIDYSRITGNSENFNLPKDWYEWKATCHHNYKLFEIADEFLALFKSQYLYLMYVWGHSFEFDRDDNWEHMEKFVQRMAFKDDIWYATNYEIYNYITAAKQLRFSAYGDFVYNPTATDIWIKIDNKITKISAGLQVEI